jgi:hypothetical protein
LNFKINQNYNVLVISKIQKSIKINQKNRSKNFENEEKFAEIIVSSPVKIGPKKAKNTCMNIYSQPFFQIYQKLNSTFSILRLS